MPSVTQFMVALFGSICLLLPQTWSWHVNSVHTVSVRQRAQLSVSAQTCFSLSGISRARQPSLQHRPALRMQADLGDVSRLTEHLEQQQRDDAEPAPQVPSAELVGGPAGPTEEAVAEALEYLTGDYVTGKKSMDDNTPPPPPPKRDWSDELFPDMPEPPSYPPLVPDLQGHVPPQLKPFCRPLGNIVEFRGFEDGVLEFDYYGPMREHHGIVQYTKHLLKDIPAIKDVVLTQMPVD